MNTIADIRRANLCALLDELGGGRGAAAELARLTGVKPPIISQLRRRTYHANGRERAMGDDIARQLERKMNKPHGWMDQEHIGTTRTEADFLRTYRALTPAQQEALAKLAETMAQSAAPPEPRSDKTLAH